MSIEERGRRTAAAPREEVQRTPRSGGRIAGQRAARPGGAADASVVTGRTTDTSRGTGRTTGASAGDGRGARRRPGGRTAAEATQGAAALQLEGPVHVTVDPAPRLRVAPPVPVSVPRAPFVALVVLVVIAGVFGILMINTKTAENTFKISKLQDQQADLDNQEQQLEERIAGYEAPGNLHANARKLGLVESGTPAYIRLPDGKVFGVPKPPNDDPAITSQQATGR